MSTFVQNGGTDLALFWDQLSVYKHGDLVVMHFVGYNALFSPTQCHFIDTVFRYSRWATIKLALDRRKLAAEVFGTIRLRRDPEWDWILRKYNHIVKRYAISHPNLYSITYVTNPYNARARIGTTYVDIKFRESEIDANRLFNAGWLELIIFERAVSDDSLKWKATKSLSTITYKSESETIVLPSVPRTVSYKTGGNYGVLRQELMSDRHFRLYKLFKGIGSNLVNHMSTIEYARSSYKSSFLGVKIVTKGRFVYAVPHKLVDMLRVKLAFRIRDVEFLSLFRFYYRKFCFELGLDVVYDEMLFLLGYVCKLDKEEESIDLIHTKKEIKSYNMTLNGQYSNVNYLEVINKVKNTPWPIKIGAVVGMAALFSRFQGKQAGNGDSKLFNKSNRLLNQIRYVGELVSRDIVKHFR